MKREIKFRVWSDFHKHFLTDQGSVFLRDVGDVYNSNYIEESNTSTTVQMFTGLKDRDGKDIFEGDITTYTVSSGSKDGMTTNDKQGNHIFHSLVVYEEGGFVGKKINGDGSLSYGFPLSVLTSETIVGNFFKRPVTCFLKADR